MPVVHPVRLLAAFPPAFRPSALPRRGARRTVDADADLRALIAAEEMKFLILGVDTQAPQLYFLNTSAIPYP